MNKDIYNKSSWNFGGNVPNVFNDHVRQSVPMYDLFIKNISDMAIYYAKKDSEIIDLGTSTGNLIRSIYENLPDRSNKFIGVDIEEDMISKCVGLHSDVNIEFKKMDAIDMDYSNTSVVGLMLVLQFMEKDERINLLKKIYNEVKTGTALFIVEKVGAKNTSIHDIYNDLYYDFKRESSLTDKAILDKNSSLRGIMKILSLDECVSILEVIGFTVNINVKYNNFVSMVAVK